MVYVHSMKSVFGGGQIEGKSANLPPSNSKSTFEDFLSGTTERYSSNGIVFTSIGDTVVLSLPKIVSSISWYFVFNLVNHSV